MDGQALGCSLENSLQCPICFGFYDTAVSFSTCQHTYCSECIRRSLSFRSQCPSCRKAASPSDLVRNRKVDELTEIWKQLRKTISFPLSHNDAKKQCEQCNIKIQQNKMATHQALCPNNNKCDISSSPTADDPNEQTCIRYQIPFYKALSDKKLRAMLKEKQILSTGNRKLLIKRHREFILQCTVQQDRTSPLSEEEIAAKVNSIFPGENKTAKQSTLSSFFQQNSNTPCDYSLFSKLISDIKERETTDNSQQELQSSDDLILLDTPPPPPKKETERIELGASPEILLEESPGSGIIENKEERKSPVSVELFLSPSVSSSGANSVLSVSPQSDHQLFLTQVPKREQWASDDSFSFSNSSIEEAQFSSRSSEDKSPPKRNRKRSTPSSTPLRRSQRKRKKTSHGNYP